MECSILIALQFFRAADGLPLLASCLDMAPDEYNIRMRRVGSAHMSECGYLLA
jgi:hypothetical protein